MLEDFRKVRQVSHKSYNYHECWCVNNILRIIISLMSYRQEIKYSYQTSLTYFLKRIYTHLEKYGREKDIHHTHIKYTWKLPIFSSKSLIMTLSKIRLKIIFCGSPLQTFHKTGFRACIHILSARSFSEPFIESLYPRGFHTFVHKDLVIAFHSFMFTQFYSFPFSW